jgi:hypothetical protein
MLNLTNLLEEGSDLKGTALFVEDGVASFVNSFIC